jgi:hypothetical protein
MRFGLGRDSEICSNVALPALFSFFCDPYRIRATFHSTATLRPDADQLARGPVQCLDAILVSGVSGLKGASPKELRRPDHKRADPDGVAECIDRRNALLPRRAWRPLVRRPIVFPAGPSDSASQTRSPVDCSGAREIQNGVTSRACSARSRPCSVDWPINSARYRTLAADQNQRISAARKCRSVWLTSSGCSWLGKPSRRPCP